MSGIENILVPVGEPRCNFKAGEWFLSGEPFQLSVRAVQDVTFQYPRQPVLEIPLKDLAQRGADNDWIPLVPEPAKPAYHVVGAGAVCRVYRTSDHEMVASFYDDVPEYRDAAAAYCEILNQRAAERARRRSDPPY